MQIAALSYLLGTIFCTSAMKMVMLILGRIMLGVGVGFANQVVFECIATLQ